MSASGIFTMATAIIERLSLSRKDNTWVDFCEGESKKTNKQQQIKQGSHRLHINHKLREVIIFSHMLCEIDQKQIDELL